MWTLTKRVEIDAAHFLGGYHGKCANMHGHRWRITFTLTARTLDKDEMVMDFSKLKRLLSKYDHQVINEIAPFCNGEMRPTAENIARVLAEQVRIESDGQLESISVEVEETPGSSVEYRIED